MIARKTKLMVQKKNFKKNLQHSKTESESETVRSCILMKAEKRGEDVGRADEKKSERG